MTSLLWVCVWTCAGFALGSLPLSLWIGRRALGVDIRRFGDGNPGGANVARAGGAAWGALAVIADGLKGAVPVGCAVWASGVAGAGLVPVALAPVAGHAFSPLLGFRGGKAVAVTFGVWAGLLSFVGPTALGILLGLWYLLLDGDAWVVMLTLVSFLALLPGLGAGPALYAVWASNAALLAWTHRRGLAVRPRLRGWAR